MAKTEITKTDPTMVVRDGNAQRFVPGIVIKDGKPTEVRRFVPSSIRPFETDSDAASEIIEQTLAAGSFDELFGEAQVQHLKDLAGQTLWFRGFKLQRSGEQYTAGATEYAVLDCVSDDGEPFIATSGASTLVAQMLRAQELGLFPMRLFVKKIVTTSGQTTFRLAKPKDDYSGEVPF